MDIYDNFTLLIDGKNAFNEIINSINNAKKSVKINMFIWRDDNIGNKIALALLNSANRGVNVEISVDRYGVICEKTEECRKSFFHKKQTLIEKFKIWFLTKFYPMKNSLKYQIDEISPLYTEIINHKNITVNCNEFKADHSKWYVIDDNTLFLGGVNIEDKENGADFQGRVYQDYMVKISGESYVKSFYNKIYNGVNFNQNFRYDINSKHTKPPIFEMEKAYLDIINNANETLFITMAYFSPLKKFTSAILNAYKRGVKVVITIPKNANFQDDSNKKTVCKLLKKSKGGINVLLSPKMLHTKLIISENEISLGSTNITKKAFNQLNELNLTVKVYNNSNFIKNLINSVIENQNQSTQVYDYKNVKYSKIRAFLEGFLV